MSNLFDAALKAEGVTGSLATLARSIYAQESGSGKNTKTSHAGARGGMQIIPSTFASVADKGWSIDDPEHNVRAGIRYLKQLDKQADGDPRLTAAGYYGGPGGLEKARRGVAVSDPLNANAPNTLQYADQVVARMDMPTRSYSENSSKNRTVVAAAPLSTGAVPLSDEFLAAVAAPKQVAHASQVDEDAWLKFLKAMVQSTKPVQVADIDYASPKMATPPAYLEPVPVQSLVPNFAAFAEFGKRRV